MHGRQNVRAPSHKVGGRVVGVCAAFLLHGLWKYDVL